MRAHLPAFRKEFEILLKKATFLKNVLEQTDINIGAGNKPNRIDILSRVAASAKVMS